MEPAEPDPVRKSPSGRIPQWAIDESLGVDSEPVAFRAPTGRSMLDDTEPLSSAARYSGGLMTAMMVVGSVALALAVLAIVLV